MSLPTEMKPDVLLPEQRVVIRARPSLQDRSYGQMLVLPPKEGKAIELFAGSWSEALPKDRELVFSIWVAKRFYGFSHGPNDFIWDVEVETVRDGGVVLHDARVCPLHKAEMQRADVRISYGLPARDFLEALENFSGGPGFVLGGCVIMDTSPKTTRGYKCEQCVAAYEKWSAGFKAKLAERNAGQE